MCLTVDTTVAASINSPLLSRTPDAVISCAPELRRTSTPASRNLSQANIESDGAFNSGISRLPCCNRMMCGRSVSRFR